MPLTDFCIKNYRSVRNVWLKLKRVNVFVGPNGSGKSNLYRAVYLMASTASGLLARNVALEGGMNSLRWYGDYGAGDPRDVFLSVRLNKLQYDLTIGKDFNRKCGEDEETLFSNDLEVKSEQIHSLKSDGLRTSILKRSKSVITARSANGDKQGYTTGLASNESVLSGLRDPYKFPELFSLRQEFLSWRFYHHFRTDRHSPMRSPQLAIATAVMSHDGSDFVSTLGTILEMGNADGLHACIEDAFPGCNVEIRPTGTGKLQLFMHYPDIERPLLAAELSDGTLQYLCLLAAIFSLDPPPLLAVNEPETSIHPSLFEPLAKLIAVASKESQVWITTHSRELADLLLEYTGCSIWELEKVEGETRLVGVGLGGYTDADQYPGT